MSPRSSASPARIWIQRGLPMRRPPHIPVRRSASAFEPLESRRHLTAVMDDYTLLITTGDGADDIGVGLISLGPMVRVLENGVESAFPFDPVRLSVVYRGGGVEQVKYYSHGIA